MSITERYLLPGLLECATKTSIFSIAQKISFQNCIGEVDIHLSSKAKTG